LRFKPLRASAWLSCALVFLPVLLASIPAAWGADNGKPPFHVRAAAEYAHKQSSEGITIAAEPCETDEQAKEAFGKLNPWRMGVLPVLIVLQNDGKDAVRLERMKITYALPDGTRVENTPAADVKYIHGARQPKPVPGPFGNVGISRAPKNPLAEWEIEGRSFAAKMIPAGQSASGFVYFQVPLSSAAATVSLSGLENAVTGKELYYFEIPLSGK
jgi:hypothetical protein